MNPFPPKSWRKIIVSVLLFVAAVVLIIKGYGYWWTGFGPHSAPDGTIVPGKTLWDWFDLLVVPAVLAIGAYLLDGSRRRSEQLIEQDRQRQQVLDNYFDSMSELVLEAGLIDTNDTTNARTIARTRTISALRLLDPERKSQLLQFLYEAGLVFADPKVQLNGAELTGALLNRAKLNGAELRGVYCDAAQMRFAQFVGADLRGSSFQDADFSGANLTNAQLTQANFRGAAFDGADLTNAELQDIDLETISLSDAQLEQLKRNFEGGAANE